MKQLYCLSTLFFCKNSQYNMPLQYLLSDAVLCLGGSTERLKILNRIGAVSSLDTHDRVATYAVGEHIAQGFRSELQPQTLTVTSLDNIEIFCSVMQWCQVQSQREAGMELLYSVFNQYQKVLFSQTRSSLRHKHHFLLKKVYVPQCLQGNEAVHHQQSPLFQNR